MNSNLFYCNHLGDNPDDREAVSQFYVDEEKGIGLERYLKEMALQDEEDSVMRTYLVRLTSTDELVGYFSLKAGLISINEEEVQGRVFFDTMPGIEIANFAINSRVLNRRPFLKGAGAVIFGGLIMPIIKQVSVSVGVKSVYLFALPYEPLISRYTSYGFNRLNEKFENDLHARIKPAYDEGCIFMYQML